MAVCGVGDKGEEGGVERGWLGMSVAKEEAQVNSWAAMEQGAFGHIGVVRVTVIRLTLLLAVSDAGRKPDSREKQV